MIDDIELSEKERELIEQWRAADPESRELFERFCEILFLDDHGRDLGAGRQIGIVKHL